ncbi:hypothetical protein HanHA300_Chr17g0663551 [Helianthus annuus]|nr:hypothetical protein HanHA300_Chr17g0663551 [Helianthus annuus]KAJ0448406.1 hypothetical protein HanHA89_Chr17g0716491 [Helianthus annuus]KAJ0633294.1 hypothetical protein HanLR1_Chr17g0675031 [Helianthus annuus]
MDTYLKITHKYKLKGLKPSIKVFVSPHSVLIIRKCVVEGEDNALILRHFTSCGGPISKEALLGVF